MTKITFGIIALNALPFLEYNLRALYPFAQEIIVVEGATRAAASLADKAGHSMDGSLSAVRRFQKEQDPERKITLVTAKDEGFKDGFWPEKDEMSQAYAKRAKGDWLWQVDSDEFYSEGDMQRVIALLDSEYPPSGVAFPFIEFWGGFESYTTGKWYLQEFPEVARIFRWGPGFSYASHRPPTVINSKGSNLTEQNWIKGSEMRKMGIFMYHYSYVLPKQAQQKVGYYSNVGWTEAFRQSDLWEQESYLKLRNPLFLGERGFPILQWLERFKGEHPKAIRQLRADMQSGRVEEAQRDSADIERLLSSPIYIIVTKSLRLLMTPYWALRKWIKGRNQVRQAKNN